MPLKKPVKQYITLNNGVIAFVVLCAMLLVFIGVGISEWKKKNKEFNRVDSELKKLDSQYKEKVVKDSLKVDSLEKVITLNSQKREKEIVKIYHEKEIRVKEINNPAITNTELRKLLAK
jgi:hypothetical protein